jgi:hypothetical protein
MQFPAKRILIPIRQMVRVRVRVGRGPDILEIALRQRRFVFRKRGRVSSRRGGPARAQKEHAKSGAGEKEKGPVTQSRWLLTVIHNHMQEYFLGLSGGLTTK